MKSNSLINTLHLSGVMDVSNKKFQVEIEKVLKKALSYSD